MSINFNELRELLGAIAQTDITELKLKSEDFELTVRQDLKGVPVTTVAAPPIAATVDVPVTPQQSVPPPTPAETPAPAVVDKKWVPITSPMVGTFYRAPAPDEAPFVEVNETIRLGQAVCIIEAMKLMNEIEAEVSGQVMEILVANGEPVEYGQTLMWVNPG